jgi:hypothetical protein
MISLLCHEEGAKALVFLGLLRQCGKRKSPAFEHFSAPARPPINIPQNIGLPWLRRPLAALGSDQFMQPVHDHLLRVNATIWLTMGNVAIVVAGFCRLGFFRSLLTLVCRSNIHFPSSRPANDFIDRSLRGALDCRSALIEANSKNEHGASRNDSMFVRPRFETSTHRVTSPLSQKLESA